MVIIYIAAESEQKMDEFLKSLSNDTGTLAALDGQEQLLYTPSRYYPVNEEGLNLYDQLTGELIEAYRNGTSLYTTYPGDGRVSAGINITEQQLAWLRQQCENSPELGICLKSQEAIAQWPGGGV